MTFNPSYVFKSRHGVYYLRYPIPVEHHPKAERHYIKLSLKTSSRKEALNIVSGLRYFGSSIINKVYMMFGGLTFVEYKAKLTEGFKQALEKRKSFFDTNGFEMGKDTSTDLYTNLEGEASSFILNDDMYKSHCELFDVPYIEPESAGREKVALLYNNLMLQLISELDKHNDGLKGTHLTSDKLLPVHNITDTPTVVESSVTLEELFNLYWKAHESSWARSTKQAYRTFSNFFLKSIDVTSSVSAFDMSVAREVKDCLSKMNNSLRTKNEYISFYSQVFLWAFNNGYTERRYFEKMAFKGKGTTKVKNKRAFAKNELKIIYDRLNESKDSLKPHFYWSSMIAIFTGARLGEITQAYKRDFYQDEEGVWLWSINDESPLQSVKRDTTKRTLPLSDKLLDLGLIDYVNSCQDEGRLFPDLPYGSGKGKFYKNVSRWFNERFLVKLELKTPSVDFHSLRRSVTTILLQSDIEEALTASVLGHKRTSMTQLYNTGGYTTAQLRRALDIIEF